MRYRKSGSRLLFDDRVQYLTKKANKANTLDAKHADLRDIVFQCCILHFSAALESYIKLVIEAWVFRLNDPKKNASNIPLRTRAYAAAHQISSHFSKYVIDKNELALNKCLEKETELWPFLCGSGALHKGFNSSIILKDNKYPSVKNIKRLFSRIGIDNIFHRLGGLCNTDVELKIDSFQSMRTALAHDAPPDVTIVDVRNYGRDMKMIVGAIDRVLCSHLSTMSGPDCWT